MPKFKRLSGKEAIKIFEHFGFSVCSQKGSHIKLRRVTAEGKETLTIPNHKQLDIGTARAIMRQASRYIPSTDLERYFYDR